MKFNECAVSPWVHDYVRTVVSGQKDREKMILSNVSPELNRLFIKFNEAVNEGVKEACTPCELPMIVDSIIFRKGYINYPDYPGSWKRFYNVKRKAVFEIALRLGVVQYKKKK